MNDLGGNDALMKDGNADDVYVEEELSMPKETELTPEDKQKLENEGIEPQGPVIDEKDLKVVNGNDGTGAESYQQNIESVYQPERADAVPQSSRQSQLTEQDSAHPVMNSQSAISENGAMKPIVEPSSSEGSLNGGTDTKSDVQLNVMQDTSKQDLGQGVVQQAVPGVGDIPVDRSQQEVSGPQLTSDPKVSPNDGTVQLNSGQSNGGLMSGQNNLYPAQGSVAGSSETHENLLQAQPGVPDGQTDASQQQTQGSAPVNQPLDLNSDRRLSPNADTVQLNSGQSNGGLMSGQNNLYPAQGSVAGSSETHENLLQAQPGVPDGQTDASQQQTQGSAPVNQPLDLNSDIRLSPNADTVQLNSGQSNGGLMSGQNNVSPSADSRSSEAEAASGLQTGLEGQQGSEAVQPMNPSPVNSYLQQAAQGGDSNKHMLPEQPNSNVETSNPEAGSIGAEVPNAPVEPVSQENHNLKPGSSNTEPINGQQGSKTLGVSDVDAQLWNQPAQSDRNASSFISQNQSGIQVAAPNQQQSGEPYGAQTPVLQLNTSESLPNANVSFNTGNYTAKLNTSFVSARNETKLNITKPQVAMQNTSKPLVHNNSFAGHEIPQNITTNKSEILNNKTVNGSLSVESDSENKVIVESTDEVEPNVPSATAVDVFNMEDEDIDAVTRGDDDEDDYEDQELDLPQTPPEAVDLQNANGDDGADSSPVYQEEHSQKSVPDELKKDLNKSRLSFRYIVSEKF